MLFVLAHNIRSLYNVGSIFRTADFFSVDQIFLTGYTATPKTQPKLAKVALGAENAVKWLYFRSPLNAIKKAKRDYPKLQILGLENNLPEKFLSRVKSLNSYTPSAPTLLILGEEVEGIQPKLLELCDQFVEIPRLGNKESLNVATAFGIAVYHLQKARS